LLRAECRLFSINSTLFAVSKKGRLASEIAHYKEAMSKQSQPQILALSAAEKFELFALTCFDCVFKSFLVSCFDSLKICGGRITFLTPLLGNLTSAWLSGPPSFYSLPFLVAVIANFRRMLKPSESSSS
jgi:hypothetical protein